MGVESSAISWWAQAEPAAAATWVGTLLSVVGLPLALYGFWVTFSEAKSAKEQASAAAAAVGRLKSSLSASSLAYTHSQIGMLVQFVADQHYHPAHVMLATVQREMLLHANDIEASENTIADIKRRLQTVSTHIGYAQVNRPKFNSITLRNALSSIQQTIVDWESAIRQQVDEALK